MSTISATSSARRRLRIPLIQLIHPRQYSLFALVACMCVLGLGAAAAQARIWPVWRIVAGGLIALLIPAIPKWRDDRRRYGTPAMLLCILVLAQGFHTIEHVTQWAQYHLLGWEMRAAVGLLSPANAEWVHFVWNWLVLLTVAIVMSQGVRNRWMWLLLAWTSAHTFEHSYMFVRYIQTLAMLHSFGVSDVTAQGLPGILGQDGWLMRSELTRGTFICRLPGLTTAPRLDVHFWWNLGEVGLMLPAANAAMAQITARQAAERRLSPSA